MIDFVFLDGPFACSKLPLKPLVKLGFEGCKVIDNNSKQSLNPNSKSFPPSPPGEIDYEGINSESQRFYCWMDSSKNIMKFDKENEEFRYGKTRLDETVFGNEESM